MSTTNSANIEPPSPMIVKKDILAQHLDMFDRQTAMNNRYNAVLAFNTNRTFEHLQAEVESNRVLIKLI